MLGIRHYRGVALDLFQGDITQFVCDVMGNAANEALAGGGGVDGAIHRVGGPTIMAECLKLGGCKTGAAVLTKAGNLPASWVAHAVGPRWEGGSKGEPFALAHAYRSCLNLAEQVSARHLALPSISTGVYGYPVEMAAKVAFATFREFCDERVNESSVERITMVLFSQPDYVAYRGQMFAIFPEEDG